MIDDSLLQEAVSAYCRKPSQWMKDPLGSGNINDTYAVRRADACFVLQRINSAVFTNPLAVIENFEKITRHLARKKSSAGFRFEVASPIMTLSGASAYIDRSGGFWRAQSYIPHTSTQVLADRRQARQVGAILGCFHHLLTDLDVTALADPLPGFHNLSRYLQVYDGICHTIAAKRDGDLQFCLEAVDRYRSSASILEHARKAGVLRLQPVHGDPKVDNFLFNRSLEPFGLLDLDTVAQGLVHCDLGDCLRSCCNKTGEAGRDCSSDATFDLGLSKAVLDGYFSVQAMVGETQRYYIFDAILLLCFELGLRFLTDYLDGNRYFKIKGEKDNLLRAVTQFRLTADVAQKEQQIRRLATSAALA